MSNTRSGAVWFALAALATLILPLATARTSPDPASAATSLEASARSAGNVTPALARLAATNPARPVSVIVQMVPGHTTAEGIRLTRAAGGSTGRVAHIINGFGARMPASAAVAVASDPAVRAVSLDAQIRARGFDPKHLRTAYTQSVGAPHFWNHGSRPATGRGVGVAVVDTGIDGSLPDFRVSRRNGFSRVIASVVVNPNASSSGDTYGHGTHVAGIIAGDGRDRPKDDPLNGAYVGVAPNAHLVSIKASDDEGRTSVLDVIYGIQFAVDHMAEYRLRVINLSLSSTVAESYLTDPLDAAVESAWLKGLVVVAAAGNSGAADDAVSYSPGNDPYVISVGAVDDGGTQNPDDDRLASWSSRGQTADGFTKPEILAPGAHIVSTLSPDSSFTRLCPDCVVDAEYFRVGGTSMAAAAVSGSVAMLLEQYPRWRPDQVKDALIRSARDVPGVGKEIEVDAANDLPPGTPFKKQSFKLNPVVAPDTGEIDYSAASWRAASWRGLLPDDPMSAAFAAASWRCDCSLTDSDAIDPKAASWRAASWRTSFTK